MSEVPEVLRSPLEAALVEALKDVRHVGDYGVLWVNEGARKIHLTMGDADGDTENGCTSFLEIARTVERAVLPFWPDWRAPDPRMLYAEGSALVFADEYNPVEGSGIDGWSEIGHFGREVTRIDALRAHDWNALIHASALIGGLLSWRYADDEEEGAAEFRQAASALEDAAKPLSEAIEILRKLAKPA